MTHENRHSMRLALRAGLAAAFFVFGLFSPAFAEIKAEPLPNHGGQLADAGEAYYYEILADKTKGITVYIYDRQAKPLKILGLPGRWTIFPANPKTEAEPLQGAFEASESGDFYWTPFPEFAGEVLHIKIEVRKEDRWVPAEFYLPLSDTGLAALIGQE